MTSTPTQPPSPPPTATPPAAPKTSGLAITALILALLPIFCINVVGVVLGIVALVKIGDRPQELKGKGLAIAAIVVGILWFFVGILAAIAIPNFIKYQARAKQSEAKVVLKSIYTAEKSTFAERGRYGATLEQIGYEPQAGRRYTYYLGDDVLAPDRAPREELPLDVESRVDDEEFQAVAVTNLDGDETLDVWVINDENELVNLSNDVAE